MKGDRPNILILLPWDASYRLGYEDLIRAAHPEFPIRTVSTLREARDLIAEATVFMAFGAAVKEDIFRNARKLRWVHAFGTGVDGIIDRDGLDPEVTVTSTRGIHGPPLSEIAILQMLALARDFPRSVRAQQQHGWDRFRAKILFKKTVGILGVGLIAEDLAPRLKALGMTVVGLTRTARDIPGFDRFRSREDLVEAVGEFDYLVLLLPLEAETRHIIDDKVLRAMKKSAYIVNIARGALIDEGALIDALKEGRLAGAALDTTEQEPLPPNHPLWEAPNLIITPHLGGFYDTYVQDAIGQILFNLDQFCAGRFEAMINREKRN